MCSVLLLLSVSIAGMCGSGLSLSVADGVGGEFQKIYVLHQSAVTTSPNREREREREGEREREHTPSQRCTVVE